MLFYLFHLQLVSFLQYSSQLSSRTEATTRDVVL